MKFYGVIGYVFTEETTPGVWEEVVKEFRYYGDVVKNYKRWENRSEEVNDNLTVDNQISVLADAFLMEHFFAIRYVQWMGVKWKVTGVEIQRPRLLLTLGGIYNGISGPMSNQELLKSSEPDEPVIEK